MAIPSINPSPKSANFAPKSTSSLAAYHIKLHSRVPWKEKKQPTLLFNVYLAQEREVGLGRQDIEKLLMYSNMKPQWRNKCLPCLSLHFHYHPASPPPQFHTWIIKTTIS